MLGLPGQPRRWKVTNGSVSTNNSTHDGTNR